MGAEVSDRTERVDEVGEMRRKPLAVEKLLNRGRQIAPLDLDDLMKRGNDGHFAAGKVCAVAGCAFAGLGRRQLGRCRCPRRWANKRKIAPPSRHTSTATMEA